MTKTTEITCDACQNNLNYTSNCVDYRLVLKDEQIPSCGGAVTSMMVYPILHGEKHFCGIGCLKVWIYSRDYK